MKKIFVCFALLILLTGCEMIDKLDNTPTKKVEAFLNKYQTLDEDVLDSLDYVVAEENSFNSEQRDKYRDIIKTNYQKLSYKIQEEEIDGDNATVTVQIEVIDYSKVLSEAENYRYENESEFMTNNKYDESKYIDYTLDRLKAAKEKVKYTLDLNLTKIDEEWILDDLTKENEAKLNGVYNY